MPAIGDQHRRGGSSTANPFDEPRPRMSEYTAQEIATLQSRLDKQLGPEYISARPGAGGKKIHYLAAEKVIGLANEVFGFNGWSSSIQNVQIDFVEENPTTGRVRLGLSVIVRVTLRDGTHHEDIGYGQIENCPGKAAAFEKCKKEGTTDALKRALRNFGNVLGNCIYDKDFLQRVTKIKTEPSRWNPDNLHRHQDYAPIKKEVPEEVIARSTDGSGDGPHAGRDEFDDAFDDADFGESRSGNPDEVVLDAEPARQRQQPTGSLRHVRPEPSYPVNQNNAATPSKRPRPPDPDQAAHIERQRQLAIERRNAALAAHKMQPPPNQSGHAGPQARPAAPQNQQPDGSNQSSSPGLTSQHFGPKDDSSFPSIPLNPSDDSQLPPVGFFSARAVNPDGDNPLPVLGSQFNPHAESPSIRKTAGIDHTRSGKVTRESLAGKPVPAVDPRQFSAPVTPGSASHRDFVNPSSDMNRKIGAPNSAVPSPMMTKSYRPPTFKRNMDGSIVPNTNSLGVRQPLSDVGNLVGQSHNTGAIRGTVTDVKRLQSIAPIGAENTPVDQMPFSGAK